MVVAVVVVAVEVNVVGLTTPEQIPSNPSKMSDKRRAIEEI